MRQIKYRMKGKKVSVKQRNGMDGPGCVKWGRRLFTSTTVARGTVTCSMGQYPISSSGGSRNVKKRVGFMRTVMNNVGM